VTTSSRIWIGGGTGAGKSTTARTLAVADLAAIRRWENEVVAANIRAWLSSPEAPREQHSYPFACECGRPRCDELVPMTIEEFDAASRVLVHA
jgi:hypothetical protein